MPNYITIPASGIGTPTPNVATDNVESLHYQYMKIVDGTPGASGYITGTTARGLLVEVSQINSAVSGTFSIGTIAAGDNNIGNVDIVTMPSVTIGSISAGDNNIGNVDIVTMPGIVVEDVASAGGLESVLIAGIRNDAASVKTSNTGDFGNFSIDSVGRLGITDLGGSISVDDNSSSLTIDNAALSVTGGGTETSALRVTIANNSTGVLSVDDNNSSLTVDGTIIATAGGGFPPTVTSDDAAGTVGIHVLGSDGTNAQIIATNSSGHVIITDGDNVITVDGTVTANAGTGTFNTKQVRSSSPSQSTVASSASNVTILASNANRLGATIYNDSSAILYLKLGSTASTTSFTIKMQAESYYEVPFNYTGIIEGLWASATGNARITELT